MVVRPATLPVKTTNLFLPVQINEKNASQIEEDTDRHHDGTINENKQNILSRRQSIVTKLHQHNDNQTWWHTTKTVPEHNFHSTKNEVFH